MNTTKIIGQVSSIFGVIFVIFAAFAAIVNYEGTTALSAFVTAGILQYYVLNGMLPFLLLAALSFTVSGVIMRSTRETVAEETKPPPAEPILESKPEEVIP